MCIIIAKPANGLSIPEAAVVKSARTNSDGMGIAYSEDGHLSVFHSMKDLEKLMKKLRYAESRNLPVLMHFRIATHGAKDEKNCHPFWVHNRSLVMAHNGVISIPGAGRDVNDSKLFVREFIRKMPLTWLDDQAWRDLVAEYIGSSKLAFLGSDGRLDILNSGYGHWEGEEYGGAWYSNHSYKTYDRAVGKGKAVTRTYGGTGVGTDKAAVKRALGLSPYWYPLDDSAEFWEWWDELDETPDPDDVEELICSSDAGSLTDEETRAKYPYGTVWTADPVTGELTLNHEKSQAYNDASKARDGGGETPRWLPATTKYRDVADDLEKGMEAEDTARSPSGVSRTHSNGYTVVGWVYHGYTFCRKCLPSTAWTDHSTTCIPVKAGQYSELCEGCGRGLEDELF